MCYRIMHQGKAAVAMGQQAPFMAQLDGTRTGPLEVGINLVKIINNL